MPGKIVYVLFNNFNKTLHLNTSFQQQRIKAYNFYSTLRNYNITEDFLNFRRRNYMQILLCIIKIHLKIISILITIKKKNLNFIKI